jgi:hypothetical protein
MNPPQQIALRPNYAVNRLTWRTSDSTDGEALGRLLRCAVIACCDTFLNDLHLSIETGRATLDQRDTCS